MVFCIYQPNNLNKYLPRTGASFPVGVRGNLVHLFPGLTRGQVVKNFTGDHLVGVFKKTLCNDQGS